MLKFIYTHAHSIEASSFCATVRNADGSRLAARDRIVTGGEIAPVHKVYVVTEQHNRTDQQTVIVVITQST